MEIFTAFNWEHFLSAFSVLLAIIDPIGIMPIVMDMRERGKVINPSKAVIYSFSLMLAFFFIGDWVLDLFGVDVHSFAIAGGVIILLMAFEMVLDITIFKDSEHSGISSTYVPLVFPLLAGAGSFTTLLSLKAEYANVNILLALLANAVVVFFVLRSTDRLRAFLGVGGTYFARKFFGIILLAISVKLLTSNLMHVINSLN